MHILFLSQVLPYPLDAGPKMRSYFVLRHLAQKFKVSLLTFVRDTDRPEDVAHLAQFCQAVYTVPMRRGSWRDIKFFVQSLLTRQPFLIVRDRVPAMVSKIRQLVESQQIDVIHADQLWMAQYALAAQKISPRSKLIMDQHNAVHLIPQRLAEGETNPIKRAILRREAGLMATYEADVCRRFDHVVWVTDEDRQTVAALSQPATNDKVETVIPICADPANVRPVGPVANKLRITFLGGLHWPPNAQGIVWFAREVFPLVRTEVPEALLTVIGKSPPAGLDGAGIEVTGYVEDLGTYLTETAAFIVPLHAGGGMRVKILDAWSWGLPIVSTTIGAEGIDILDGQNIMIADDARTFAQAVTDLLKNPGLSRQLGQNGRKSVLEKYDWQVVYSAWDEVYRDVSGDTKNVEPGAKIKAG